MATQQKTDLMGLGMSPELANQVDNTYAPLASPVFTGNITVPGALITPAANFETVAGAGTVQGDAAALSATKYVHQITGANGTVGWILPVTTSADIGKVHKLYNTTAGVAKIYPGTGGTINGGAANAVLSLTTGIQVVECYASAANTWIIA